MSGTAHPKVMKLIGNEKIAHEWGARYHPMYEFHGGPGAPVGAAAPNPRTGTFTELPQNRDSHEPLDPALPLPFPPSKSVH